MPIYMTTAIQSQADAESFLFQLDQDGLLFHPDDDPASIIGADGKPTFTPAQADTVRQRMVEVFQYLDDPCAYALALSNPESDRE